VENVNSGVVEQTVRPPEGTPSTPHCPVVDDSVNVYPVREDVYRRSGGRARQNVNDAALTGESLGEARDKICAAVSVRGVGAKADRDP
jgi:hypothetical protein